MLPKSTQKHMKGVWMPSHAVDGDMICHHVSTTTHISPNFWSQLKSLVTAWCCDVWNPCASIEAPILPEMLSTLTSFIKRVFRNLYAVEGYMDPSAHHYHYTCSSRFWKFDEILCHFLALKECLLPWLRLQTQMEWFPHPLQPYERHLVTFICCGWEYGSVIWPLQTHLLV